MTESQARAAGFTEEQIAALHLASGSHSSPEAGMCLLEAVSVDAGEPFGDHPETTDPVLAAFGRSWNDHLPDDERQTLKKYIPLLRGTNKGPKLQTVRACMALDWITRYLAPMWLEQVPELAKHAAKLRALAPITSELGKAERTDAIEKSTAAAWDAWDAWAAAAAAYEATKGCATYEEARAKADAVFMAKRDETQAALQDLFTRMINAELTDAAEQDRDEP